MMEIQIFQLLELLNFGPRVRLLVQPGFELFRNENFAPNLAAWMLIVAAVLALVFSAQITVVRLRLRRIINRLRKLPSQEDFAREFPGVDAAILRVRYFRPGW